MKEKEQFIIVGLGNPGVEYRDTRHNVGFLFVDYLAHRWDFPLFDLIDNILISRKEFKGKEITIAKPTTYMNRSGLALATLSGLMSFGAENLVVCYDDLDIASGKFKLRSSGGAGGHKGMISILRYVGGEDVKRVKFGILPPEKPEDVESFVLSPFEEEEENTVYDLFPQAMSAVECLLEEGIDKAMSLYNRDTSGQVNREV